MLFRGKKEVNSLFKRTTPIATIMRGLKLVWEAVNSCFGKGYWVNAKPWSNKDGWKNNTK